MKIAMGKVVGGKVELEGDPLAEGSVVTVISTEDGETIDGSPTTSARCRRRLPRLTAVRSSPGTN